MKALQIEDDGYAGFYRPEDVISEPSLSAEQKYETLKHWQLSLARRARVAPVSERETYENLTVELAAAIECVDSVQSGAHNYSDHRKARG